MDLDPLDNGQLAARQGPASSSHDTHRSPDDAGRSRSVPGTVSWLLRRWPTVLAGGLVITTGALPPMWAMHFLPVLPLLYLVLVAIGRRVATWPVLAGLTVLFLVLEHYAVDTFTVIAILAVVGTVLAVVAGRAREAGWQAAAFVGFFVVALAAMYLDRTAGILLVAGGWAAHGLWDFWHLLRDKVVARTFAEACGVLDILAAAGLLLAL
jgi:hypothetical protein